MDERYKRDALVQAWIDRRQLATIINWMLRRGRNPLHLSEVLKLAVDELTKKAVAEGARFVELTEDAHNIINNCFRVNLNRGGKGLQNFRYNVRVDEMRLARVEKVDERSGAVAQADQEALNIDKAQLLVDSGVAPNLSAAARMVEKHEVGRDEEPPQMAKVVLDE